ncbi:hypothetical protein AUJ67_04840 [Candidatus Desantisbacteria bacterium CG1_02_49_89]|nr:MAG: hypothetical protein AUJ67_04840 [Candidatus Desantisbacteria bacterium CG1_02_49_89]PJB27835.1 MAG: hypothetical protein CO111_03160 [Candidatus Desantisbacteria bacterium CG_4_9_14_3_um_filter_50_7]
MKKLLVVLAVLALAAGSACAFDIGAGVRYAGLGVFTNFSSIPVTSLGAIQGEVVLGPINVAIGYADLGSGLTVYPLSVGAVGKFPLPLVKPYIGGEFTYFFIPNSTYSFYGIPTGFTIMEIEAKAGVEGRLGNLGIYGGIGYGTTICLLSFGPLSFPALVPGMTWEVGARYYLF